MQQILATFHERKAEDVSANNVLGRHNYTLAECRQGLEKDIAEFGSRYSLLSKALELLDTSQENQELVREWFDVYMSVFDEESYNACAAILEGLEVQILKSWYTHTKRSR